MQKKWKKIVIVVSASILLLLTLPKIANYTSEKDVQRLERILNAP